MADSPDRGELLTALTTEHFTLQGARSQTMSESSSRAALYIGAVSSTLVALGFLGQLAPGGDTFNTFALTVLPTLYVLGVFTFVRLVECGAEDFRYGLAINRIRHYYTEIDPSQAHYFLLSGRDDFRGALANMCIRDSWTQFLFTMPSAVAVINALLAGVTVSLALVTTVAAALPVTVLTGMALGTTVLGLHLAYQVRRFATMKANVAAVFPSTRPRPKLVRSPQ
ncbi:MAG TPA: hypothetical protein VHS79_11740 [Actinomycetes bacterium]|nr:hypothetical protein [Actinomycetes bacterium]